MLAEGGRFPQNYCDAGRESAVYEVVTMLTFNAIDWQRSHHVWRELIELSKKDCATRYVERRSPEALVHAGTLVIVVVLVPIALGVPAMRVFVPPLVLCLPAAVALRREFTAPVSGFLAVRTVMRDSIVQVMVNLLDSALAVVSADRRGRKCQETGHGCHRHRYFCGIPNICAILHGRCFLLMD
jgi:hypothetical protein